MRIRAIASYAKRAAVLGLSAYVQAFLKPKGGHTYVLILAHMRSGSSLMAHLLMGHPGILGGGERNQTYATPADFRRLAAMLHLENRRFLRSPRLILDQINHDRMLRDPSMITLPNVKKLFLIREPIGSVSSMVRTFEPLYGGWNVDRAAEYYESRLKTLCQYAKLIREQASLDDSFFTTYDQLLSNPQTVLDGIQEFLNLDEPIQEQYPLQRCTGKRGDPSPTIRAGTIVRKTNREPIEIAKHIQSHLNQCYLECRSVLGGLPNSGVLELRKAA